MIFGENRPHIHCLSPNGLAVKDLEIDNTGNLIFDGSIMQKQLNYDLPLQINATRGNLETLFRPSNCSFSSSFIKSFSDTLGVLSVSSFVSRGSRVVEQI